MSTVALDQFKQQIEKLNESKQVPLQISIANAVDSEDADLYYESVDYCDENVEYVMYDSSANIIEDTYIPKKAHETQEIDAVHQRTYNLTIDKVWLQFPPQTTRPSKASFPFLTGHITPKQFKKKMFEFIEKNEADC